MKSNRKFSKAVQWILAIGSGALTALIGGSYIRRYGAGSEYGVLFLSYFIAFFLHIILHELGHLVFGLRSGYRFVSFRIGSLMLVKKQEKLRLRRFRLMGTAGQCLLDPPEAKNETYPYVLYNMGGVIFNFTAALIFLIFCWIEKGPLAFLLFMLSMAVIGFLFTALNGFPMQCDGINNDGWNAINLSGSREAMRCFWLQLKINARLAEDTRLKEMPDTWFAVSREAVLQNCLCASLAVLSCYREIDRMNFPRAEQTGKELLEQAETLPGILRWELGSELLYCELVGQRRREILDLLLTPHVRRFMKKMASHPSVLRVQYAYALLAEGDTAAAEKLLKRFTKITREYPNECELEAEQELIAYADRIYAAGGPDLSGKTVFYNS